MGKNSFQFKQFTVNQEHCAMKVGTDGTLLGAWAKAPIAESWILDIGTGTGLIALMMAQRYPESQIVGIDIDKNAAQQAQENASHSPFGDRIKIVCDDATKMDDNLKFDAIVCNPPYFVDSLTCPEDQRTLARHTATLNYQSLMKTAKKLLKNDGILSVVIPTDNSEDIESAVAMEGLFIRRICLIKTTPQKFPKRKLIEIGKQSLNETEFNEEILETIPGKRIDWYHNLTKDFYLR